LHALSHSFERSQSHINDKKHYTYIVISMWLLACSGAYLYCCGGTGFSLSDKEDYAVRTTLLSIPQSQLLFSGGPSILKSQRKRYSQVSRRLAYGRSMCCAI